MIEQTHAARALTTPSPRPLRLAALTGIAAPLIFLVGVLLATWNAWDFLHAHGWSVADHAAVPWPSGTVLAEHGWVQSANFAITGTLLLVFVRALRHEFRPGRSGQIASALLTLLAVALAFSAFNTDIGSFGGTPDTWHGWIHLIGFVTVMLSAAVGMTATGLALRGSVRWRGLSAAAFVVALSVPVGLAIPGGAGFYGLLLLLFGWFELAALRFSKLTGAAAR